MTGRIDEGDAERMPRVEGMQVIVIRGQTSFAEGTERQVIDRTGNVREGKTWQGTDRDGGATR